MTSTTQGALAHPDPGQGDNDVYVVVVNDEEQYSLWPAELVPPNRWGATGIRGPKAECLAWVRERWTDMVPKSLRRDTAEGRRDEQ